MFDTIQTQLNPSLHAMPNQLAEAFFSYWPAVGGHIRSIRNEVGHPTNIEPVTIEKAEAMLRLFPMKLFFAQELIAWISSSYG